MINDLGSFIFHCCFDLVCQSLMFSYRDSIFMLEVDDSANCEYINVFFIFIASIFFSTQSSNSWWVFVHSVFCVVNRSIIPEIQYN